MATPAARWLTPSGPDGVVPAGPGHYRLSHLRALEAQSIHVFREVAAEFERPVAAVLGRQGLHRHAAPGARRPSGRRPSPFPSLHVDTGRNFDEVLEFRDRHADDVWDCASSSAACRTTSTPAATVRGHVRRRDAQPAADADAAAGHPRRASHDAVFGGARRDEEKARAKERIFSFRDEFGQWDPKNQRPELWNLYNARHNKGEHIRVFPLSNWTELDVWNYIRGRADRRPVDLLRPPAHRCSSATACSWRSPSTSTPSAGDRGVRGHGALPHGRRRRLHGLRRVHGRDTIDLVIAEVAGTRLTERGATRADDRISEAGMEDRKREGYF